MTYMHVSRPGWSGRKREVVLEILRGLGTLAAAIAVALAIWAYAVVVIVVFGGQP